MTNAATTDDLLAIAEQAVAAFNFLSIRASTKADREEFKRREMAARAVIDRTKEILPKS